MKHLVVITNSTEVSVRDFAAWNVDFNRETLACVSKVVSFVALKASVLGSVELAVGDCRVFFKGDAFVV